MMYIPTYICKLHIENSIFDVIQIQFTNRKRANPKSGQSRLVIPIYKSGSKCQVRKSQELGTFITFGFPTEMGNIH